MSTGLLTELDIFKATLIEAQGIHSHSLNNDPEQGIYLRKTGVKISKTRIFLEIFDTKEGSASVPYRRNTALPKGCI